MNIFVDNIQNPKVKELMFQFFYEADRLYNDIDALSYEEFIIRKNAMWELRNKAYEIDGDVFLIHLHSLDEKVKKIYGEQNIVM